MRYLKDYFLTDDYFIRGHATTGRGRLTGHLNGRDREFVEVEQAACVRWDGHAITSGRAVIRIGEILLAYEAAETGDEALRQLAGQTWDKQEVTICMSSRMHLVVRGRMRRGMCERDDLGAHRFIVLTDPRVAGPDGADTLLPPGTPLPYSQPPPHSARLCLTQRAAVTPTQIPPSEPPAGG
jgi:hypothetical protein